MNHIQISIKFDEDTHDKITQMTGKMRITPHKFIVTAVQEMQRMIEDRGKERVPLLVVQARAALDYEQEAPPLPIHSDAGPPQRASKAEDKSRGKSTR
jgi:hypothetical protein